MNPEMSNKQLVRLLPETLKAIDQYRKAIKRETGKTPSINGAINTLIFIGAHSAQNRQAQTQEPKP